MGNVIRTQSAPTSSLSAGTTRVSTTALRVTADLIAASAAAGAALLLRFQLGFLELTEPAASTTQAHAVAAAVWTVALMCALVWNRLYDEDTLFEGAGELSRVFRAVLESAAFFSAFVFLSQAFYVSRSWFVMTMLLSAVFLLLTRLSFRAALDGLRANGIRQRPVVLVSADVATGDEGFEIIREFAVQERVDLDALRERLGNEEAPTMWQSLTSERAALLVPANDVSQDELWQLVMDAGDKGHPVFIYAPLRGVRRDRMTVRELGTRTIVKIAPPRLTGARAIQKRTFDVLVSTTSLLLLFPVFFLIGVAIVSTAGFPILHRQERTGRNGKSFSVLKFRSMVRDAESQTGPVWAAEHDSRTTAVGRLLRRTSLDELPQLVNVLKGEMSLVGPRPERPNFVEQFSREIDWYPYRHRIRPGMTGWAQAHGHRGNTPLNPRIESDNWYIEHWSLSLDLAIIARTVLEVVRGERRG